MGVGGWGGDGSDGMSFGWQNGDTALHLAAGRGHDGAVKVLLEAGADREAKNKVSVDMWDVEQAWRAHRAHQNA
eukprot:3665154-Rhodomonas_salina.1